jgi:hypothetical protein
MPLPDPMASYSIVTSGAIALYRSIQWRSRGSTNVEPNPERTARSYTPGARVITLALRPVSAGSVP